MARQIGLVLIVLATVWFLSARGSISEAETTCLGGTIGSSGSFEPVISPDGRFVAFESGASNLVPGDTNGVVDVFLYDRQTGATVRVSVDSAGREGNGDSRRPAISADGRYVSFGSYADNLVSGDTNGTVDAFVHDRQTGATVRVSVDSVANQSGGSCLRTSISADGRFVGFRSYANDLVAGDTNGFSDAFIHDRDADGNGILDEPGDIATTRVSVNSDGKQAKGASFIPHLSADGRFVSFASAASNLVVGDTNKVLDVFVHDRQTGETTRVSVSSTGQQANGASKIAYITGDGQLVAFRSLASNLVPEDTNGFQDVFVHDLQTGTTTRVSVDSAGNQGNSESFDPAASYDGRFVGFGSRATNLVADDTNGVKDVFVHDLRTGATTRTSVDSAGGQGNKSSYSASLSADGCVVAFASFANNLVEGDANHRADVFVHDCLTGETSRVSVGREARLTMGRGV